MNNGYTHTHRHTHWKQGKGKRLALLREKVSMAASSSWSQTELLSRPGRISQEEQQEGREVARARGVRAKRWISLVAKQEQREPRNASEEHKEGQTKTYDTYLLTYLELIASLIRRMSSRWEIILLLWIVVMRLTHWFYIFIGCGSTSNFNKFQFCVV